MKQRKSQSQRIESKRRGTGTGRDKDHTLMRSEPLWLPVWSTMVEHCRRLGKTPVIINLIS